MATEDRKVQLGVVVDASDAKAGFNEIKDGAKDMAQAVTKAGKDAGQGLSGIGEGVGPAVEKLTRGQSALLEQIKRTSIGVTEGKAALTEYKASAAGIGDFAAPYISKLREAERGQADLGMSAKATAAALRGIPAQMTDIVVSLQGGQAPLTVLLQQGGQLKDMFGGVVPAAKALGGAVLGLINPFTVAAAAAAVLGYAFIKGQQESQEYSKALILSGNAAGTTVRQLQGMATNIAAVTGSQSQGAAALAAFAASGDVGASSLERFSLAAIKFEKTTGSAVASTVKQFEELKKSPLEASLKLNESMNYLTVGIYNQIKALEEQGKTTEAANLAQKTFADTLDSRSTAITQNLGSIERGWLAVKRAVSGAVDELLKVGRAATPADGMAELQRRIATEEAKLANKGFGSTGGGAATGMAMSPGRLAEIQAGVDAMKEQLSIAKRVEETKAGIARQDATSAANVKALAGWDKEGDQFKQNSQKRTEAVLKAEIEGRELLNKKLITQKDYEQRIADIKEKYKDPKGPATPAGVTFSDSSLADLKAKLSASKDYLAQLKLEGSAAKELNEGQKLAASLAERLTLATTDKARASLTAAKAIADQWGETLKQTEAEKAAIKAKKEFEAERQKGLVAQESEILKIQEKASATRDEIDAYGLGKEALAALTIQRLEDRKAVLAGFPGSEAEIDQINRKIAALTTLGQTQDVLSGMKLDTKESDQSFKELERYFDPTKAQRFGDALAGSFNKAGNSLDKMIKSLQNYGTRAETIEKARLQNARALADGKQSEIETNQKSASLDSDSLKNQIGLFGDLADSASAFFEKNSAGYRTLQTVSAVFHAAQFALQAQDMVQKAISAVLTQGTGDPYSAFARMAAMAAFVGALGVSVGGGGGGGGGEGSGYKGIAQGGTGTVLGMENDPSKSIGNSLDILADNSRIELTVSQRMLSEMTQVKEGIMGLAGKASSDFFIRGMAGGSFGDDFLDSGIGFFPGQTINDIISKGVAGIGFNLIFDQGAKAIWKELDPEFKSGVGAVLGNVFDTIMSAADNLSLNDPDIKERMLSLIPTLGDTSTYAMNGVTGQGGGLVSLKDKSGKEIQEELEAIFSAVGDQMAGAALPSLKVFQRVGEGMFETLVRVTTGIESANYSLEQFGITAIDYTDIVRKSGDIATEIIRQSTMALEQGADGSLTGVGRILELFEGTSDDMLTLYTTLMDVRGAMRNVGAEAMDLSAMMVRGAGGIDKLQSGLGDYFDAFFTDAEKAAAGQARLAEQFKIIGQVVPGSIQAFRDQVQAIDTSTDAGAKLFGQLMALSGAFADVQDSIKAVADKRNEIEIAILRAQGDELGAVARERANELAALAKLDPSLAALQGSLYAISDAADAAAVATAAAAAAQNAAATNFFKPIDYQAAVNGFVTNGTAAIDKLLGGVKDSAAAAQIASAQGAAASAKAAVTAWESSANSIRSVLERIRADNANFVEPTLQYSRVKLEFDAAAAAAMGGDLDQAKLVGALGESFLKVSEQTSGSRVDYLRDRALTEAKLALTLDKADSQISIQQAIADAGTAQVAQLQALNANLTGFAAQAFELLSKSYPTADRGTAEGIVATLASMQAKQDAFFTNDEGTKYHYSGLGGEADFVRLAGNMAAFINSDGSSSFFRQTDSILEVAKRIPELRAIWEKEFGIKLPAFASGGLHMGGARLVGENGPEIEITGPSRILNARQTSSLLGGGSDLVEAMREVQRILREGNLDRRSGAAASVRSTNQIVKKLDAVTDGGDTLKVTV
ncbi:phage tail length tape measure family protein [Variovorax sp. H27-G14]|uniref:phage tail length tape measure family protein n=1 Tax=Variovorax sp. H27-G14 TaxID=3111914 RepID=UPI0038FD12F7